MKFRAKLRLSRLYYKRVRKLHRSGKLFNITLSKATKHLAEFDLRVAFAAESLRHLNTSLDKVILRMPDLVTDDNIVD